ncbi:MAG TPA: hypothetical protein VFD91_02200 [Mariniphaga sp.]|nr:hypothetical protein [Mariniphaga sp.]
MNYYENHKNDANDNLTPLYKYGEVVSARHTDYTFEPDILNKKPEY